MSVCMLKNQRYSIFRFDHQMPFQKIEPLLCGLGNSALTITLSGFWSTFLQDWLSGLRWTRLRNIIGFFFNDFIIPYGGNLCLMKIRWDKIYGEGSI